jgi:hypothetical protein
MILAGKSKRNRPLPVDLPAGKCRVNFELYRLLWASQLNVHKVPGPRFSNAAGREHLIQSKRKRLSFGEKFQIAKDKQQMVRQAHHPEPSRWANHNDQNLKCQTCLGHRILTFGIYLEFACPPFFWRGACILVFGIILARRASTEI